MIERQDKIALDFLVHECRGGNTEAQRKVYEMYSDAMYSCALRITANSMDAQDILQEAFVDAFNKIDRYRGEGTFGSWLKRIVVNRALNHVTRSKVRYDDLDDAGDWEEEEDAKEEPEYTIEMVKAAMNQLPDGYRVVFSLFAFEGIPHKQIAEQLGITESTSKSQYNRAKKKIKEIVIKELANG